MFLIPAVICIKAPDASPSPVSAHDNSQNHVNMRPHLTLALCLGLSLSGAAGRP